MKVLNVHVTNVNIRQQQREFLRLTNNLNMKVLNIPCLPHLSQERWNSNSKELSKNESKDFIINIQDSTDATLAADDDKEVLED